MHRTPEDRVDDAARLIEQLLVDQRFRARFRRRPAAVARAFGLGDVAQELGADRPFQTLEVRQSRSSLAGAFLAAAAESADALDLVRDLDPGDAGEAAQALRAGATRAHLRVVSATELQPIPLRVSETADADGAADAAAEGAAYPGDDAPREEIAAWMAAHARAAGLPPELPVMAALVESELENLDHGHSDSVGFFQMRQRFWDRGPYAGYLERPELQLKWFIARALEERRENPGAYDNPEDYGRWAADIEQCADEFRGRYQLRLDDASELVGAARKAPPPEPESRPAEVPASPATDRPVIHNTGAVARPRPAAADAEPDADSGTSVGERMVRMARGEVGVAETSENDSERIAEYRTATAGSAPGPWCAFFVSWLANESGSALGADGQGFGLVDDVWRWAESAGRAVPAGPGVVPEPGDLIVWDEHIGIVEEVLPDGRIQTIEGNSGDHVARRVYPPGEGIGYVRMP